MLPKVLRRKTERARRQRAVESGPVRQAQQKPNRSASKCEQVRTSFTFLRLE